MTADEYPVGYGRPPLKSRWKKGQSGNPRKKPKRQETAVGLIDKLLLSPVKLTVNDEPQTITALGAIVLQLQLKEMSGNARASRVLLKYKEFASQHTERRVELIFVDGDYTRAISNGAPEATMADDDVGYGRPPKKFRFKPGVSGNPKGRPKRDPGALGTSSRVP
jgi:Family of unknown function (DUF5681)